jgi:hypothetical protein
MKINEEHFLAEMKIPYLVLLDDLERKIQDILKRNPGLSSSDIQVCAAELKGEYTNSGVLFLCYDK